MFSEMFERLFVILLLLVVVLLLSRTTVCQRNVLGDPCSPAGSYDRNVYTYTYVCKVTIILSAVTSAVMLV